MVPRIAISNYADALAIFEVLSEAHYEVTVKTRSAFIQADIDGCRNTADHLAGLMALVADEVLRIGNEPADTVSAHPDRASAEDMAMACVTHDCGDCNQCRDDHLAEIRSGA